jgi:hypothetical protein
MAKTVTIQPQDTDIPPFDEGDTIIFAPGVHSAPRTLFPKSRCIVQGKGAVLRPRAAGRDITPIVIKPVMREVKVSDIVGDTARPDQTSVISVSGSDCTFDNIEQVGSGKVMQFDGAKNLTATRLWGRNGNLRDKAMFGAGDIVNENCNYSLFEFEVSAGTQPGDKGAEHGIRVAQHTGIVLGHPTKKLGAMAKLNDGRGKDFAGYISDVSQYQGAALLIKAGKGARVFNLLIDGTFVIGPHKELAPTQPNLRTDDTVVDGGAVYGKLQLSHGAINTTLKNLFVRAVKIPLGGKYDYNTVIGCPLQIDGPLAAWPAADVKEVINCRFEGAAMPTEQFKRVKKWTNSFWNGVLITPLP